MNPHEDEDDATMGEVHAEDSQIFNLVDVVRTWRSGFYNRIDEIYELFVHNALPYCRTNKPGMDISWRNESLCVAAQIYGAGKTTLGTVFLEKLIEYRVEIEARIRANYPALVEKLLNELNIACDSRSNPLTVIVNLNGAQSLAGCNVKIANLLKVKGGPSPGETISDLLIRWKMENPAVKVLFLCFDEIADLSEFDREFSAFRSQLVAVWSEIINKTLSDVSVYFYLCGKAIDLSHIARAWKGSPCSTFWLVLRRLHSDSIAKLRQDFDQHISSLKNLCARFNVLGGELDRLVGEWTGGNPRMIRYMFGALEHEARKWDDRQPFVLEQLMIKAGLLILNEPSGTARNELFVDNPHSVKVFFLALWRYPVNYNSMVCGVTVSAILAELPVYIGDSTSGGRFLIVLPKLSRLAMECSPSFLQQYPGLHAWMPLASAIHDEQKGPTFELCIYNALMTRVLFHRGVSEDLASTSSLSIGDVLPTLSGSLAAALPLSDLLSHSGEISCTIIPKFAGNSASTPDWSTISFDELGTLSILQPKDLISYLRTLFEKGGRVPRVCCPRGKSQSADLLLLYPTRWVHIQAKAGLTEFGWKNLCDEVEKARIDECPPSSFIVAAQSLSKKLSKLVERRGALVLGSGVWKIFQHQNTTYLAQKRGTQIEIVLSSAQNFLPPGKTVSFSNSGTLDVGDENEVIILSPNSIRQLIGETIFDAIKSGTTEKLVEYYSKYQTRDPSHPFLPAPQYSNAPQATSFWVTLDNSGVFRVFPAMNDVDGLKDAVKQKQNPRLDYLPSSDLVVVRAGAAINSYEVARERALDPRSKLEENQEYAVFTPPRA